MQVTESLGLDPVSLSIKGADYGGLNTTNDLFNTAVDCVKKAMESFGLSHKGGGMSSVLMAHHKDTQDRHHWRLKI